ncbi:MAG: hypothetical protein HN675_14325, partial [Opitutae bacterium]|nr:hypothetical protein [Opitutae bacterium]
MKHLFTGIPLVMAVAIQAAGPTVYSPSKHLSTGAQGILSSVDSNKNSKWCGLHENRPVVWMAKFPGEGKVIREYSITSGNDEPSRDPKDWMLEGSKDGTKWNLLDKRTNQPLFEKRLQ